MIYYTPSPEKAYTSILDLVNNVPFGQMLRDMHRLGAEGMVIFTFLHMLRTFLTGSYKKERSFTWLTGVVLLGITMFLSFSGYLLPWDQLAYWAVTVGTSMADAAPLIGNAGQPAAARRAGYRRQRLAALLPAARGAAAAGRHPGDQHPLLQSLARAWHLAAGRVSKKGNVPPEVKKAAKQRIDYIPDLLTTRGVLTQPWACSSWCWPSPYFGYHAPLESIANPQVTPLDTEGALVFLVAARHAQAGG